MSDLSGSIKQVIEGEDVALFMKGTPQMVMCGNSLRALEALRRAGAPVTTVDILPDPAIRQELSAQSGWPTIPQVFVRGELIGGADIVEELEAVGRARAEARRRRSAPATATRATRRPSASSELSHVPNGEDRQRHDHDQCGSAVERRAGTDRSAIGPAAAKPTGMSAIDPSMS